MPPAQHPPPEHTVTTTRLRPPVPTHSTCMTGDVPQGAPLHVCLVAPRSVFFGGTDVLGCVLGGCDHGVDACWGGALRMLHDGGSCNADL